MKYTLFMEADVGRASLVVSDDLLEIVRIGQKLCLRLQAGGENVRLWIERDDGAFIPISGFTRDEILMLKRIH